MNLHQLYMCHFDNVLIARLSKYPQGPHSCLLFAAFTQRLFPTFFRWLHAVWILPTSVNLSWQTRMDLIWTVYNFVIETQVIIRCSLLFFLGSHSIWYLSRHQIQICKPSCEMSWVLGKHVSYRIQSNCWCMTLFKLYIVIQPMLRECGG